MDKRKLFSIIAILFTVTLFSWDVNDFLFDKDAAYQDIWIDGEVLYKGCGPDCPSRYEALQPLLRSFERPFSVLEIGANSGYFCFRIAHDYDATCVMIDGTDRLTKLCEANSSLKHIIYLKKFLNAADLKKLSSEHFDVILCFHVLHHVDDWRSFVDELLHLGDYVVIETPPANDGFISLKPTIPAIARYLLSLPFGTQIGSFARQSPEIRDHMILFTSPFGQFSPNQTYPFPGISLATFNALNGVYPIVQKKTNPKQWLLMGTDCVRILP